ncbi:MAG TPA: helix-turn-helix transcriptional regulator [Chitinophagaceae bacterium]|nr:helix-turn-helix transcriptional regulator [Chitinophagaceae bacterium]
MDTTAPPAIPKTVHQGRNIRHFRELRGIKQESFAAELHMSQQNLSRIEQTALLDEQTLLLVSGALGVNPETIRNFDPDSAINLINNIHDNKFDNSSTAMIYQQFNPLEKIIELYERLLKMEREMIQLENRFRQLQESRNAG